MKKFMANCILLAIVLASSGIAKSETITGDPSVDNGWVLTGHSLENGVYVKGNANYGYDAYGAGFTIQAGSNLEISDEDMSWLAGDTVVGVGGVFTSITAEEAGWDAFTGNGVNSLLPTSSPYVGPKLQAKFGTSGATWYTSTTVPNGGNGNSSSSSGGGRVQVRTSGYFQTGTPNSGQTEPWTWDGNSGQLLVLDKEDHISWDGDSSLDKRVARMIWNWDDTAKQVTSWQLLLNVSLLERQAPEDFSGSFPSVGDMAIMTVQDGSGSYTDALVNVGVVPEPGMFVLLGGLLLVGAYRRFKR